MQKKPNNLFASKRSSTLACGLAGVIVSVVFSAANAGTQETPASSDTRDRGEPRPQVDPRDHPRHEGREGGTPRQATRSEFEAMPLPPDWPRAGGFGPNLGSNLSGGAGGGRARPLIEGMVIDEMMSGEFGRREMSEADVARVVAVAKLVSPAWGDVLEARAKQAPEQWRLSLRSDGRRLLALVALQERAPKVFEAKIVELRAQAETARIAGELRRATSEVDAEAAAPANNVNLAELEKSLEEAVAAQVAATLATRREELLAIEQRLEKMRADLDADDANAAALVEELKTRARAPRKPSRDSSRDSSRELERESQ